MNNEIKDQYIRTITPIEERYYLRKELSIILHISEDNNFISGGDVDNLIDSILNSDS